MNRLIFADTETTGIDPKHERLLEVALIEVVDRVQTGHVLHQYFEARCVAICLRTLLPAFDPTRIAP